MTPLHPDSVISAKTARVALEERIPVDVEKAIHAESSVADVARCLGKTREHMYRVIGKEPKTRFPLAWVFLLPPAVMLRVLRQHLGPLGYTVAELPPVDASPDDLQAMISIQRETADVVTQGLNAIADGVVTAGEAAPLIREIDEAIAALLTVRQVMERAVRERVVAVARANVTPIREAK